MHFLFVFGSTLIDIVHSIGAHLWLRCYHHVVMVWTRLLFLLLLTKLGWMLPTQDAASTLFHILWLPGSVWIIHCSTTWESIFSVVSFFVQKPISGCKLWMHVLVHCMCSLIVGLLFSYLLSFHKIFPLLAIYLHPYSFEITFHLKCYNENYNLSFLNLKFLII